ncbi:hypothetical protein CEY16_13475 [Halalkalibacillus sediminis]|uniref:Uncharacterized protein n=1 Tax=Halalkalibacillus sediminis TaxID=2018042 RepID=A0A2I0QR61_9BACI|nr:hypothetical protein [Halalkalibacillus sediminis]PKR76821.1 hypothetical protein CEY16_13475 [Halalkalibacillus sediminis]
MLKGPLLMAIGPGLLAILITWILGKFKLPVYVRIIPGILALFGAFYIAYNGYVNIRGFEGGAHLFLAFFLFMFATIALLMGINHRKIEEVVDDYKEGELHEKS